MEPEVLYCPIGHAVMVDEFEPDGHVYPAEQFPEHAEDRKPLTPPYCPAAHRVQVAVPPGLNCPGGQTLEV